MHINLPIYLRAIRCITWVVCGRGNPSPTVRKHHSLQYSSYHYTTQKCGFQYKKGKLFKRNKLPFWFRYCFVVGCLADEQNPLRGLLPPQAVPLPLGGRPYV